MHPAHLVRYLGRTRQIAVLPDRRDRIGMAEIISARAISDTEVTCVQGTGCESTNSAGETLALQSLDALVHDLRPTFSIDPIRTVYSLHHRCLSGGAFHVKPNLTRTTPHGTYVFPNTSKLPAARHQTQPPYTVLLCQGAVATDSER
ncbi:hypothetical protein LTR73_007342 [Friedmanniomyces endolithicus]|nr:hypothetical protein LTR73_007342 [Friedmanniomyces endolithicus]